MKNSRTTHYLELLETTRTSLEMADNAVVMEPDHVPQQPVGVFPLSDQHGSAPDAANVGEISGRLKSETPKSEPMQGLTQNDPDADPDQYPKIQS